MRYAQIRKTDISNGEGVGIALYTAGCFFHCKNCFNKELWDENAGQEWTQEIENTFIALAAPQYIKRISILGGEPFIDNNLIQLYDLVKKIKTLYPEKKIWIYSGYTFDVLKEKAENILQYVDILVDGLFVDELKDMKLKFKGSSNQRVIDIQESLKKGKVVLYL